MLEHIYKLTKFMKEHKEELRKDTASYEYLLSALKKAKDDLEEETQQEPETALTPPSSPASRYKKWEPRQDYSDAHKAAITKLVYEGYSPREAERLAGAHKGPKNLQEALKSNIQPNEPSTKMLASLKELAGAWKEKHRNMELAEADEFKNPMKHAAGQIEQAHKAATGDYSKAYNDFLASDAAKNLSGLARHKAVQEWKKDWKAKNPEYEDKLENASEAHSQIGQAHENIKQKTADIESQLKTGGVGEIPDESQVAAAQHLGIGSKSDEAPQVGIMESDVSRMARHNPNLVALLNKPEHAEKLDRMNRVDAAKASQAPKVIRRTKAPTGEE